MHYLIYYINQYQTKKNSTFLFSMDYHQFFYDSLSIILQAFDEYIPKDYLTSLRKKYQNIITPFKSIYVQIFAYSNHTKTKIQQWKFKPKSQTNQPHLQRSYSHQNSNEDDSELSFSQLNEPTFFKTLQNIRKNIQPKLLLKKMERPRIICQIKDNQQQLVAFDNGNTFYFEVSEYENQLFEVKLSFKYNYEDQVVAKQLNEMKIIKQSDSGDFELLVDQSYQNILKNQMQIIQRIKQIIPMKFEIEGQRKMSQKIVFSGKNLLLNQINQISQNEKFLKSKREQQFMQIQKLYNNIDFSAVESSKLKAFLQYLL